MCEKVVRFFLFIVHSTGREHHGGRQLCVTALMLPPIPTPSPNHNVLVMTDQIGKVKTTGTRKWEERKSGSPDTVEKPAKLVKSIDNRAMAALPSEAETMGQRIEQYESGRYKGNS